MLLAIGRQGLDVSFGFAVRALCARKYTQAVTVDQFDMFAVDPQQAFILEAGKQTADGFQGQSQVVADIATRHAEVELIGGKPSPYKAIGYAYKK